MKDEGYEGREGVIIQDPGRNHRRLEQGLNFTPQLYGFQFCVTYTTDVLEIKLLGVIIKYNIIDIFITF